MKLRITLFGALLFFTLAASIGGQTRRSRDAAPLRDKFVAAVTADFELVKDEFKSHPSGDSKGTFWLAHLRPKQTGHYALQYRFKPQHQSYSHVEHEIFFTVAPKACRRGPPSFGVYSRFCMGDTIIVPVIAEASTSSYQFSVRRTPPAADEEWKTFEERHPEWPDRNVDKTPVTNSLEFLKYVGRSAHKAFHRSPGYTLGLEAHFEAVKPGRFNLVVSSSADRGTFATNSRNSTPIIVVETDTPVVLLAGREEIRGFTVGHNGEEYVSSTTGHGYSTSLVIMQPGDRISRSYLTVRRNAMFEREGYARDGRDPAEAVLPVISAQPFNHDPAYDYGGWLKEYLP